MLIKVWIFVLFSSPGPKAQDELLRSLPVRRPPSVRLSFHTLNDFSSETPEPNFFEIHVEPSVKGGLKIFVRSAQ